MIITLAQFKKLPFYKENTSLYESVFASNAFLINNKDGFIIYMYELIDKDYASHEEFNFHPLKLGRVSNIALPQAQNKATSPTRQPLVMSLKTKM